MQKILIILMATLALSACSSKPPSPPEPKGEFIPVNPDQVQISELKL
ncbi:lipoprotein [Candidatus Enterovibrio escicola]|nr:lipoprotein [Candidatus Enterovibrio escacola]